MKGTPDNSIGLTSHEQALIAGVLERHDPVNQAWLFGSRAKGTHRPESDVDIALDGAIDEALTARIAGDLSELPLPYLFDVVARQSLSHGALAEHITRIGI